MNEDLSPLKERLLLRKREREFPHRSEVPRSSFTDANDHNPLVRANCSTCRGSGKCCEEFEENGVWCAGLSECDNCGGTGVSPDGRVEPFFSNDAPPAEATLRADGWLTCPGCHKHFSTKDADRWTGLRHISCGQRITIKAA